MKVGIRFANSDWRSAPEAAADFAVEAERCGFESVWAVDRPAVPWGESAEYPYSGDGALPQWFHDIDLPEPLVWLTFVAARTSTLVLGTGVLVLPLRSPVLVAKQAATLDGLSKGRLRLGVGSGWLREEFEAVGLPFENRHERLEESVQAMRELWTNPVATFSGSHVSFTRFDVRPRPARPVPIHVGGRSFAAARRAGRFGDGFCPPGGSPERVATLIAAARAEAEMSGRDPSGLEVTVGVEHPDEVAAFCRAGADRVLFAPPGRDRTGGTAGLRELSTALRRVGVQPGRDDAF